MRLLKSITTVGSYTIGSRLFGFVREILTASFLGSGAAADALVLAVKLPSFFRRLFAEGAFNASFVPVFSRLLSSEGEDNARSFAEQIFTLLAFFLFLLVVFVEFFLPSILPVIVPGLKDTPERLQYAIEFTRITFPFIFFISLTALYSGLLNSVDKFAAAASSPMIGNMAILAVVLGLYDVFHSSGVAFSLGITVCGLFQFLWVLIPAWRRGMFLRFRKPQLNPSVKRFFTVMGPAAMGSGVVQINLFIGAYIASWLPTGALSYLNYADRLNHLPLSVVGVAVSTALLPLLSRQIRQGLTCEAHFNQNTALEFSLFLVLPAMTGLICLAHPLIQMVYERGAFTSQATAATAMTLQAFAIGLPAYVMIKVFSSVFFAHQDTKTPVVTAVIGIGVDIVLSLLLMGALQQVGIALATAAAAWVNALFLGAVLWRRGALRFNQRLVTFFPKITLCCLVMGAGVYGLYGECADLIARSPDFIGYAITLCLVGAGVGLFATLAHLTGAMRWDHLRDLYSGKSMPATA